MQPERRIRSAHTRVASQYFRLEIYAEWLLLLVGRVYREYSSTTFFRLGKQGRVHRTRDNGEGMCVVDSFLSVR